MGNFIDYLSNLEFLPTYLWGCLAAFPVPLVCVFVEKGLTLTIGDLFGCFLISLGSWTVALIGIFAIAFALIAITFTIIVVLPFRLIVVLMETPIGRKKIF